jgi:solute carrier family 13 (sodium-dependent dicarboxylate transporter), member 2/3/5
MSAAPPEETSPMLRRIGLMAGPVLMALVLLLPAPAGLSREAWLVVALVTLMAVWWMTEAIPMAMTAFLPIIYLPLTGASTLKEATTPFAEPIIFLLLGGFIVALAIERWGLHKRIALFVLDLVGASPSRLVLGFIIATAFLSMWISNSATTMMMLPIALSVASVMHQTNPDDKTFAPAAILGVAYAASIGGMGTLVGTPPNAMAAGYVKQTFQTEISFGAWMQIGVPVMLILIPLCWIILTRLAFRVSATEHPGVHTLVHGLRAGQGPMSKAEIRTALLCSLLAILWIFSAQLKKLPGLSGVSDELIAMLFAVLMFLIPSGMVRDEKLLNWGDTLNINWGVIFLFGGGLSLAAAMDRTGLAQWLGDFLSVLKDVHPLVLLLIMCGTVTALSEIASNTALVAALLPVLGAGATATGLPPETLAIPLALAANCGFMLPAATGPNAIAFGSGRIKAAHMARAGILLDIAGVVVIALVCWLAL